MAPKIGGNKYSKQSKNDKEQNEDIGMIDKDDKYDEPSDDKSISFENFGKH